MKLLVAFSSIVVALASATPALAEGGGLKPSEAPLVTVGQHYFGSTEHEENLGHYEYDFWKLPPLLVRDRVTVAWSDQDSNSMCIAADVDDFSWGENVCNASDSTSVSDSGSARSRLVAEKSSSIAFLQFGTCCTGGPYDFTVEAIQHTIGLGLDRVTTLRRGKRRLTGSALLANATPIPNGLVFTLTGTWKGKTISSESSTVAGRLDFRFHIPKSGRGQRIAFRISRSEDRTYLASRSAVLGVQVK